MCIRKESRGKRTSKRTRYRWYKILMAGETEREKRKSLPLKYTGQAP
jgi:hypothetical protein